MKTALITGVTGQDGSYLSEFLLDKGYEVHGIIRRSSVDYRERIAHLEGQPHFHLHYADMSDSMGLIKVIGKVRPDEIYNLAAQSHVQVSFDSPEFTADIDAVGVLRILEAVRACGLADTCRIYQASTSELYGKVEEVPQNENTPFHPYSPYAVAKLYGYFRATSSTPATKRARIQVATTTSTVDSINWRRSGQLQRRISAAVSAINCRIRLIIDFLLLFSIAVSVICLYKNGREGEARTHDLRFWRPLL